MYSFIHLFSKHILNGYYRPDTVLGIDKKKKNAETVRPPSRTSYGDESQENKKHRNIKHSDVYCEAVYELLI